MTLTDMITGGDTVLQYNWDNKLRKADWGISDYIALKYDPLGNRIWKQSREGQNTTTRKYIVDIVGALPVILLEIDPGTGDIDNSYIYANGQIIAQHTAGEPAQNNQYFFLHDRLGSIRLVTDINGNVKNRYIYEPFGDLYDNSYDFEEQVTDCGCFRFTGQYFDSEIDQYYLRARQYYPHIGRFTSRDPIFGQFEDPLSLHKYLYCKNDPLNGADPLGLWTFHITGTWMASFGISAVGQMGIVIDDNGNVGIIEISAIGAGSPAATLGVSFGVTSADTIFELEGPGAQIGGTFTGLPFVPGVEFLVGGSGENTYVGFEATFGLTRTPAPPPFSAEIHGHYTETMVVPLPGVNLKQTSEKMENYLMDAIFSSQTLGEAYGLLFIWGILPD